LYSDGVFCSTFHHAHAEAANANAPHRPTSGAQRRSADIRPSASATASSDPTRISPMRIGVE
jgi:hypothetical protein